MFNNIVFLKTDTKGWIWFECLFQFQPSFERFKKRMKKIDLVECRDKVHTPKSIH